jgi:alcohol dehydrogenase class IV
VRFEFATATRIIFGTGTLEQVGPLAAAMGSRALVVLGRSVERAGPLLALLAGHGVATVTFPVAGEPTIHLVLSGVSLAKAKQCDLVVGFGGGSVLDTGKAIASLLANTGDIEDYLEIIGKGKLLTAASEPYIAIPTTAGTGTEVTRNAVLASPEHRVKVSLRSPLMLPRLAIVDPALTYGLPPNVTAATGLDALTQLIEPFVSSKANPVTDALCREGIGRAARSFRQAYAHGDDPAAREDMALASLFGGLALANGGLGAVHGFAGPIGGMFPAPHGAICARLLPHVMATNVRQLQQSAGVALQRYGEIGRILTGDPQATAQDAVTWVRELVRDLRLPPLATYGVTAADFSALVEKATVASSMQANPVKLTPAQMREILTQAL